MVIFNSYVKLPEGISPSLSNRKGQDLTNKVIWVPPRLRNLGKHPGIAVERHPCGSNCINGPAGISWKIFDISKVGLLFL